MGLIVCFVLIIAMFYLLHYLKRTNSTQEADNVSDLKEIVIVPHAPRPEDNDMHRMSAFMRRVAREPAQERAHSPRPEAYSLAFSMAAQERVSSPVPPLSPSPSLSPRSSRSRPFVSIDDELE